MKSLTQKSGVCSFASVAKVGAMSALIGVGLFFSACGSSDEFKPQSIAEKQIVEVIKNKFPNAKILNFSAVQKEFGLKDNECLKSKGTMDADDIIDYYFIKMANGELQVRQVLINNRTNGGIPSDIYTIEQIKTQKPECFN